MRELAMGPTPHPGMLLINFYISTLPPPPTHHYWQGGRAAAPAIAPSQRRHVMQPAVHPNPIFTSLACSFRFMSQLLPS